MIICVFVEQRELTCGFGWAARMYSLFYQIGREDQLIEMLLEKIGICV